MATPARRQRNTEPAAASRSGVTGRDIRLSRFPTTASASPQNKARVGSCRYATCPTVRPGVANTRKTPRRRSQAIGRDGIRRSFLHQAAQAAPAHPPPEHAEPAANSARGRLPGQEGPSPAIDRTPRVRFRKAAPAERSLCQCVSSTARKRSARIPVSFKPSRKSPASESMPTSTAGIRLPPPPRTSRLNRRACENTTRRG
jgi:hypothetical protein